MAPPPAPDWRGGRVVVHLAQDHHIGGGRRVQRVRAISRGGRRQQRREAKTAPAPASASLVSGEGSDALARLRSRLRRILAKAAASSWRTRSFDRPSSSPRIPACAGRRAACARHDEALAGVQRCIALTSQSRSVRGVARSTARPPARRHPPARRSTRARRRRTTAWRSARSPTPTAGPPSSRRHASGTPTSARSSGAAGGRQNLAPLPRLALQPGLHAAHVEEQRLLADEVDPVRTIDQLRIT
jgi:hypothetical protein